MTLAPGFHSLWPTPVTVIRNPAATEIDPLLARVFGALRVGQLNARQETRGSFFASDDDLLQRVKLKEWDGFVGFLVESLRDTAKQANAGTWPADGMDLQIAIKGMWFQFSNNGAFHDTHTHGNCSWSGVYIVQVDEPARRASHPVYGQANGVTRLYGPPFAALGGAFVDVGNAYLQPPHIDVEPIAGQLVLFPSWLAHQALPYDGESERIIVSFNASVHAAGGDQMHRYSAS